MPCPRLAPFFAAAALALSACQADSLTGVVGNQTANSRAGTGTTGNTGNPDNNGNPGGGATTATARVICEVRATRSKISVDGNGLSPAGGTFTAQATSGNHSATAKAKKAVGDEVEFDFDSDSGDIAAGATAIAADFIVGSSVTGQILNEAGAVVASATATCSSR